MLPIHFAPLQGYTEAPYRRIHNKICGGIASYYTPFVRIEKGEIRNKDIRDISAAADEGIECVPQAIARDSAELEQILGVVAREGHKRMDINMGCPYPMQTRHGRGAGILANQKAVGKICDLIREHQEISFSIKMRLGMDSDTEWKDIIEILNETPLLHITMHPRIGKQMYKGEINEQAFTEFVQACDHPVIYNGDIRTLQEINKIEATHPRLAGIMIGRGLLSRPTLAREYREGKNYTEEQVISKTIDMHKELVELYSEMYQDENQRLGKLHAFWEYLEEAIGRKRWKEIMKSTKWTKYIDITNQIIA